MMKRLSQIIMVFLFTVFLIVPVSVLAMEDYRVSYKNVWSNLNSETMVNTGANIYDVADGSIVVSVGHDLKALDMILNLSRKANNDKEYDPLFNYIENSIKPVVRISKYDDMGNLLWKDEFEENLAISYGLFEDSKQNIYLIGLEGLRIYDKNGKLIDINRNIKGYDIYQFNDGYVVFNLRLKEYYDWGKNNTISRKESREKEAEWFEVLYYDKNFNLIRSDGDITLSLTPSVLFQDDKMYYLTKDGNLNEVDSKYNVVSNYVEIEESVNNFSFDDISPFVTSLIKKDDKFYLISLSGIFQIDSNYVLTEVETGLSSDNVHFLPTGFIERDNKYFVAGMELVISDTDENNELTAGTKIKILDQDFKYIGEEIDVSGDFGFNKNDMDDTITVPVKINNLRDGFAVTGVNVKDFAKYFNSLQEYLDYLDCIYSVASRENDVETYLAERCPTEAPLIQYFKTKAYVVKYGTGYQIKTNVINGSGRVAVSKSFSMGNEKIVYTVMPQTGFKIESLRVYTVSGREIEVVDNTFEMPDEDVIIDVSFKELLNPTTSMYISGVIFCLAIVGAASYLVLVRNRKSN